MTYALRYMPDSPPPDDLAERNRRRRLRWAAAKKEYLAGDTAKVVCARHDMPLSTFRHHASVEGWRRCDADDLKRLRPRRPAATPPAPPAPPTPSPSGLTGGSDDPPARPEPLERRPHPGDAEAPQTPALGSGPRATADSEDDFYARLAADARRHMVRAVRAGRPLDAQRWLKLTRQFTDLADQERKAAEQQAIAVAEAADTAARDAGVLIDLAGPLPFGKLSEDQLIYAANALRRAIDSCAARKQAAERARQSAEILDSQPEKRLDSPLSSPACGGGGPPPGPSEARPEDRLHGGGGEPRSPEPPVSRRHPSTNATKSTAFTAPGRPAPGERPPRH
ncbi:hypothetical protein [Brevundimonas sp.]|uniref:hypothetical protein n=1 Tax=Brevundimonas sp. TaxID=1871086 RepID=UPI0035B11359